MGYPKFIKIKGLEGPNTGYFVPKLYRIPFTWTVVKVFGLSYIKERLNGWTIWFVDNEEDYIQAIKALNKLKKTRIFEYEVSE